MNRPFFKSWLQRKTKPKEKKKSYQERLSEIGNDYKDGNENYHAAIGKMAAFFAHEIRNPLTSIIGFTQYLEQNETIRSDPTIAQYTSIIKDEAIRMEALIQELLTFAKAHLDEENLSLIDVKRSIEKVILIQKMKQDKKEIRFRTDLAEGLYISGNVTRFEQVLINLIKNAVEAIEEEGTISIKLSNDQDAVILVIHDDGPGIAEDQLENIFYPFFTTKDEGTGLGLPICKTIIEAMEGTLEIKNHPKRGVVVTLTIPKGKNMMI
ncbi:sensor histidine kinase [Halalkalibacterium halodurans]|jgi:signal transduction histidine kinase|uniref:histidine kinase n=1 Tax=Halalkalibacterium halodurans TaxID=86665 RepID=A0A0M0KG81_ALKHA|nr:HAMP domain-containing sensor histidine kinase [Halalkalibacterium halodurans]MED4164278.1 HAMP domain-containing sensor histidine kinase [Halalkalibacterium halodurans]TPE66723.1 HAMP domain-containing histidine kinase [Halalkalibacterium halodurans]